MKRDGFACYYCSATGPGVNLHIDHIKPVVKGGTNDIDNLVVACQHCNVSKKDRYNELSDISSYPHKIRYLRNELENLQRPEWYVNKVFAYEQTIASMNSQLEKAKREVANCKSEADYYKDQANKACKISLQNSETNSKLLASFGVNKTDPVEIYDQEQHYAMIRDIYNSYERYKKPISRPSTALENIKLIIGRVFSGSTT